VQYSSHGRQPTEKEREMTKAEAVERIIELDVEKKLLVDEAWDKNLDWEVIKHQVANINGEMYALADTVKPFSECNHTNIDCYHYYGIAPIGATR